MITNQIRFRTIFKKYFKLHLIVPFDFRILFATRKEITKMPRIEKRNELIQTRVTEGLRLRLKKYCDKHDCSEAHAVRLALKKILHNVPEKQTRNKRII